MQTFLPYPDMMKSFSCLDQKRLGKQRVETRQLIKSMVREDRDLLSEIREGAEVSLLTNDQKRLHEDIYEIPYVKGWANHPARTMWMGCLGALAIYHDLSILAWKARGYNNTLSFLSIPGKHKLPIWWGDEAFHSSHRSNLLRKDPHWYSHFGWLEGPDQEYIWPSPT